MLNYHSGIYKIIIVGNTTLFNYDSGIYKTINDEIKLCLINRAMYKTIDDVYNFV